MNLVKYNKCVLILPVKENIMVYISHSYHSISIIKKNKDKIIMSRYSPYHLEG